MRHAGFVMIFLLLLTPVLAEEQPDAYKDIDAVVECVAAAGLARTVARLRPMGVIKG